VQDNATLWSEEFQRRSNAYLTGRESIKRLLKPGVDAIHFIFSSFDGELAG
jgi:hypothetical protein